MIDFNKDAEENFYDAETCEPVIEDGCDTGLEDDQSDIPTASEIDSTNERCSLDGSSTRALSPDDPSLQSAPIDDLEEDQSKKSVLDHLLAYSKPFQRFVTDNGEVYVGYNFNRRFETHSVESKFIKRFLTKRYFDDTGKVFSKSDFKKFCDIYSINAENDEDQSVVHTRVAKIDDAYFLDTADDGGHIVRIDASGWSVQSNSMPFIRPNSMLSIALPEEGGSIDDLREFVRLSDDDFKILIAFIIDCFRADTIKPVLYINGEPGSSKTTLVKIIMQLVDSSSRSVVSLPRNQRDLMIFACKTWLLPFDNLSKITEAMSNSLCGVTTGAGMSIRKLYSDFEEIIFNVRRPMILSGIEDFISRPDLLSRCVMIRTLPMEPEKRREETSFWSEFDNKKSKILGALLKAFSEALGGNDPILQSANTRMKDFALLGSALEQSESLGWDAGAFQQALEEKQQTKIETNLEGNTLSDHVRSIAETGTWNGTSLDLLKQVEQKYPSANDLPNSAKELSIRLREISPMLREMGIDIQFPSEPAWSPQHKATIRKISITKSA